MLDGAGCNDYACSNVQKDMTRAGLVLAIAGMLCAIPGNADDPVVFRSNVALVRVDAQVVDGYNRAIAGLGPRDFVLFDSGQRQPIQSVDTENLPIDLVLLLDVSASMRPHIQRIAAASHQAMRQLRQQDRVAILVFDRQMRVRMNFRSSQSGVDQELQRLLDEESFRGGTDITGGLLDAADYIGREGRIDARKAIVIVTDDQTELNRDVEGVSRALTRADAVLCALIAPDAMRSGSYPGGGYPAGGYPGGGYPGRGYPGGPLGGVIFGPPRGPVGYPGGGTIGSHTQSAGTREIARDSGGDTMSVDDVYALQDTLARLRQRYALHYYLPAGARAGEERSIQLQLADAVRSRYPGAGVRYRRNYYAPTSLPANISGAPTVVTQSAPQDRSGNSNGDPDRPYLRRGVSQVPDRSLDGPLIGDGPGNAAPPPSQAPAAARPAPSPPAAPPDPNAPGWRKARPDDLPQQQHP